VGDICEGKNAVCHDDIWRMKRKNTIGKLVWVEDVAVYDPTPRSKLEPQPRPENTSWYRYSRPC
jgi:hypothetical protein